MHDNNNQGLLVQRKKNSEGQAAADASVHEKSQQPGFHKSRNGIRWELVNTSGGSGGAVERPAPGTNGGIRVC